MPFPSTQSIPFWSLISSHFPKQNHSIDSVLLCMRLKWGISAPHSRRRNHRRTPSPTPPPCPFPATVGHECALRGERRPETRWLRSRLWKWRRRFSRNVHSILLCPLIALLRSGSRPPVRRIGTPCREVRVLGLAPSLTLSFNLSSLLIRFVQFWISLCDWLVWMIEDSMFDCSWMSFNSKFYVVDCEIVHFVWGNWIFSGQFWTNFSGKFGRLDPNGSF